MIIGIITAVVTFVVGVFGFSQIFVCLVFAIPTSQRFKRDGTFRSDMPVFKKYLPPVLIWVCILAAFYYLVSRYLDEYMTYALVAMIAAAIISLLNSGANKNNVEEFIEQNSDYMHR